MSNHIGILGGTFDPIHRGHIHLAQTMIKELNLDQLHLVPVQHPVHKESPEVSTEHRLKMMTLAVEGQSDITIDRREIDRTTPSYSYLTVKEFRQEFPDAYLYFILGIDAANHFDSWYRWRDIINFANLIMVPRPGVVFKPSKELNDFFMQKMVNTVSDIRQSRQDHFYRSESLMLDFSSTEVRQALSTDSDVMKMLDSKVMEHINQHRLYS